MRQADFAGGGGSEGCPSFALPPSPRLPPTLKLRRTCRRIGGASHFGDSTKLTAGRLKVGNKLARHEVATRSRLANNAVGASHFDMLKVVNKLARHEVALGERGFNEIIGKVLSLNYWSSFFDPRLLRISFHKRKPELRTSQPETPEIMMTVPFEGSPASASEGVRQMSRR